MTHEDALALIEAIKHFEAVIVYLALIFGLCKFFGALFGGGNNNGKP